eukprot:6029268-Lingulodinium_polyedra.AAC.1
MCGSLPPSRWGPGYGTARATPFSTSWLKGQRQQTVVPVAVPPAWQPQSCSRTRGCPARNCVG